MNYASQAAQGMGMNTNEPQRAPAVGSALDRLEKTIAAAEEVSSILLNRLEPVLRQEPPLPSSEKNVRPIAACGMAERIGNLQERSHAVYEIMRRALERLEV